MKELRAQSNPLGRTSVQLFAPVGKTGKSSASQRSIASSGSSERFSTTTVSHFLILFSLNRCCLSLEIFVESSGWIDKTVSCTSITQSSPKVLSKRVVWDFHSRREFTY